MGPGGRRRANRQKKISPNSPVGVAQRWVAALAKKDLKTLKELTSSKARGDLAELTKEKPDEKKVEQLVKLYGKLYIDRGLPPRGTTAIVVVREGSQSGPPMQLVLRREKGKWRVYEVRKRKR